MRWVIAQLAVIAIGMTVFVYVILPSHPGMLGGGFFLALGALNALFCKSTGRKFFAKTQSSAPFVANFWAHSGERGTQLLFLGIGIILAVAGCILLVVGSA
jgi:Ca2+/Na+ antiporter